MCTSYRRWVSFFASPFVPGGNQAPINTREDTGVSVASVGVLIVQSGPGIDLGPRSCGQARVFLSFSQGYRCAYPFSTARYTPRVSRASPWPLQSAALDGVFIIITLTSFLPRILSPDVWSQIDNNLPTRSWVRRYLNRSSPLKCSPPSDFRLMANSPSTDSLATPEAEVLQAQSHASVGDARTRFNVFAFFLPPPTRAGLASRWNTSRDLTSAHSGTPTSLPTPPSPPLITPDDSQTLPLPYPNVQSVGPRNTHAGNMDPVPLTTGTAQRFAYSIPSELPYSRDSTENHPPRDTLSPSAAPNTAPSSVSYKETASIQARLVVTCRPGDTA